MNTSYVGPTSDHSSHRELMKTQVMVREGQSFWTEIKQGVQGSSHHIKRYGRPYSKHFNLHFYSVLTKSLRRRIQEQKMTLIFLEEEPEEQRSSIAVV